MKKIIINLLIFIIMLTQAPFEQLFPGLNDLQMAAINQLQQDNSNRLFELAFAHAVSSYVGNEPGVERGLLPFMEGIFGTCAGENGPKYFDQTKIQEIGEEQFYANAIGFLDSNTEVIVKKYNSVTDLANCLAGCTSDSIIETFMIYVVVRSISLDLDLYHAIKNARNHIVQKANKEKTRYELKSAVILMLMNIREIEYNQFMQNQELTRQRIQEMSSTNLEEIRRGINRAQEARNQEIIDQEARALRAENIGRRIANLGELLWKLCHVCACLPGL